MLGLPCRRDAERSLVGIVMLLAGLSGISLSLARSGSVFGWDTVLCFAAATAFAAAHLLLAAARSDGDQVIMTLIAAAAALGYVSVLRLRPDLALRQLSFIWIGVGVMVAAALWQSKGRASGSGMTLAAGAAALLLVTLAFGQERGGARSWIFIGGMGFQPSEFAKIACVLAGADALSTLPACREAPSPSPSAGPHRAGLGQMWASRPVRAVFVTWFVIVALTVLQRDVGTAAIIYISCVALAYVASGNRHLVLGAAALGVAGVGLASKFFSHVGARFAAWSNPWADVAGSSYQIVQAFYALGSGGMLGRGYGSGSPWLIPAAPTDMLFAASAEEIGLAGSLGVIAVYFLLIGHAYACAMRGRSPRQQLAAVGAANILAVQIFVIIGGNLGVLPLTGVTLPFASYGGSSMISSLALAGILLGSTSECRPASAEASAVVVGRDGRHESRGDGTDGGGGGGGDGS